VYAGGLYKGYNRSFAGGGIKLPASLVCQAFHRPQLCLGKRFGKFFARFKPDVDFGYVGGAHLLFGF
jgi:hypothetical protein